MEEVIVEVVMEEEIMVEAVLEEEVMVEVVMEKEAMVEVVWELHFCAQFQGTAVVSLTTSAIP